MLCECTGKRGSAGVCRRMDVWLLPGYDKQVTHSMAPALYYCQYQDHMYLTGGGSQRLMV